MNELIEKINFHEQVLFDTKNHSLIGIRNELSGSSIILSIVSNHLAEYLCDSCNKEYDIPGYKFFIYPMNRWFGSIESSSFSFSSSSSETIPTIWTAYKNYQNDLEQSIQDCFSKLQKLYESNPVIDPTWPLECRQYFASLSQNSSAEISIDLVMDEYEPVNNNNIQKETIQKPIDKFDEKELNDMSNDTQDHHHPLNHQTIDEYQSHCNTEIHEVVDELHSQELNKEEMKEEIVQGLEDVKVSEPMTDSQTKEMNRSETVEVKEEQSSPPQKKSNRKNQSSSLNKKKKKDKNISIGLIPPESI